MIFENKSIISSLKITDGNVFFQDYTIKEKIGSGNNSVFSLQHVKTGQQVALKEIIIQNDVSLKHVKQEISIHQHLTKLDFPHIIRMIDYCIFEQEKQFSSLKTAYILFEKGITNLTSFIQKQTELGLTLSQTEIVSFNEQLIKALAFLESQNISHGDIKPENIIIMQRSPIIIKICDMGCGAFSEATTLSMTIKGTIPFMAPESILQTQKLNSAQVNQHKADMFSYGLVMIYFINKQKFFSWERQVYSEEVQQQILELQLQKIKNNPLIDLNFFQNLKQSLAWKAFGRPTFSQIKQKLYQEKQLKLQTVKNESKSDPYKTQTELASIVEKPKINKEAKKNITPFSIPDHAKPPLSTRRNMYVPQEKDSLSIRQKASSRQQSSKKQKEQEFQETLQKSHRRTNSGSMKAMIEKKKSRSFNMSQEEVQLQQQQQQSIIQEPEIVYDATFQMVMLNEIPENIQIQGLPIVLVFKDIIDQRAITFLEKLQDFFFKKIVLLIEEHSVIQNLQESFYNLMKNLVSQCKYVLINVKYHTDFDFIKDLKCKKLHIQTNQNIGIDKEFFMNHENLYSLGLDQIKDFKLPPQIKNFNFNYTNEYSLINNNPLKTFISRSFDQSILQQIKHQRTIKYFNIKVIKMAQTDVQSLFDFIQEQSNLVRIHLNLQKIDVKDKVLLKFIENLTYLFKLKQIKMKLPKMNKEIFKTLLNISNYYSLDYLIIKAPWIYTIESMQKEMKKIITKNHFFHLSGFKMNFQSILLNFSEIDFDLSAKYCQQFQQANIPLYKKRYFCSKCSKKMCRHCVHLHKDHIRQVFSIGKQIFQCKHNYSFDSYKQHFKFIEEIEPEECNKEIKEQTTLRQKQKELTSFRP